MLIPSRMVVITAMSGCLAVFSGIIGAADNVTHPFAFTNEDGQKVVVYGAETCPDDDLDNGSSFEKLLREVVGMMPSNIDPATSCFTPTGEEVEVKMMKENPDRAGIWIINDSTLTRDELQTMKSSSS
ncbi:hypothetical protein ACJ7V3_18565 [Halomonas elongata]|uniref:hypothetical protein n=1 Tax=Halomonas elongata TaxID=2746 RepID=UPI0038D3BEFE